MPVWLAVLLGTMTPTTALAAFVASRLDAVRGQHDKSLSQLQEDAKYWREDYRAIRERLVASEAHVDEVEADCKQQIAARDGRIAKLERELADVVIELRALRPSGRP